MGILPLPSLELITVVDLAPTAAPLSSFHPYRRRQALAAIARELAVRSEPPVTAADPTRRVDVAGLNAALHQLAASADPVVVFTHLAHLLVPVLCDEAAAAVLTGEELARWQQQPPLTADIPTSRIGPDGRGWTVTVHTAGHPDEDDEDAAEPGYVAALTCRGHGEHPTAGEVALIKLAGRCAATAVHQAQQTKLLAARQRQVQHLQIAVDTNRSIGAAVGVLMVQRRLSYPQAFHCLVEASQDSNVKLAAVADTVLYTGTLPAPRHRTRPPVGSVSTDHGR